MSIRLIQVSAQDLDSVVTVLSAMKHVQFVQKIEGKGIAVVILEREIRLDDYYNHIEKIFLTIPIIDRIEPIGVDSLTTSINNYKKELKTEISTVLKNIQPEWNNEPIKAFAARLAAWSDVYNDVTNALKE